MKALIGMLFSFFVRLFPSHSRTTWVTFLSRKDDVSNALKQLNSCEEVNHLVVVVFVDSFVLF